MDLPPGTPRLSEEGLLYRTVAENLESYLGRREEQDRPAPGFVERQFRSFLECGVPARGFLRLRCRNCGHERAVAFSCKGRVWCPSCGGRRMSDTAAHLVDRVFPAVPVRQWVLSLPFALRYRMGYDAHLTSAVLTLFIRALFGDLRRRARKQGIVKASCGSVTFIQRFGDALNLNPHFHCLVIDGVYRPGPDQTPEFHPLPAPEDGDVLRIVTRVHRRVRALLERRGIGQDADPDEADPLSRDDPGTAALLAHSVLRRVAVGPNTGQPLCRTGDRIDPEDAGFGGARCAMVSGFSLHANVSIPAGDRSRLERLCRYAGRPAVATGRLSELPDGRLLYRLKRPWRDGTRAIVFEPQDFIAKLAALTPAPRAHLVRYHGILGPAARHRSRIVPGTAVSDIPPAPSPAVQDEPAPNAPDPKQAGTHPRNYRWAELMKRVFLVDVLQCESCGGERKVLAAIHPPLARIGSISALS
jgi:ribosomal protein S27E